MKTERTIEQVIEDFKKGIFKKTPEGYSHTVYGGHYPLDEWHVLYNEQGIEVANFYLDY